MTDTNETLRLMQELKALSIRQAWAYAITHLGKDIENRTWRTEFRGPVLIHAGLQLDKDSAQWISAMFNVLIPNNLPLGGIVGYAEIIDCVPHSNSEWFFGPNGFVLEKVRPLPFVPCKGRLGFFKAEVSG